jgi:glutathione S-transferase kappa 1
MEIRGLTRPQPQRCLVYIKANRPRQTYESTFLSLWQHIYELGVDISKPPNMAKALSSSGFTPDEVGEILAAASDSEYKELLLANTQKALDYGAFGAPWFWVRNAKGKEEPFFGSDRFHYIYDFLGVPFQDIAIKEKGKL